MSNNDKANISILGLSPDRYYITHRTDAVKLYKHHNVSRGLNLSIARSTAPVPYRLMYLCVVLMS